MDSCFIGLVPYRLDIYELLNRTSSRIVQKVAASRLAREFLIVLPPKVKIKNRTSSVYSSLYGIWYWHYNFVPLCTKRRRHLCMTFAVMTYHANHFVTKSGKGKKQAWNFKAMWIFGRALCRIEENFRF